MKKTFHYQKIWLRVVGFLPILFFVYLLQTQVIHKLTVTDNVVYSIDAVIVLLFLSVYCKMSEKFTWYIRQGEYWIEEDRLVLKLNKEIVRINLEDLNEVFMTKNSWLGSYHIVFQIKWKRKKCKIISAPISEKTELDETQFMDIFNLARTYSNKLETVKDVFGNDTEYWLKSS